jgi:hypothetical protein
MKAVVALLAGLSGGVGACVEHVPPPPPPLPPPPAPLLIPAASGDEPSPEPTRDASAPPRPQPTGDREHDALALGFWGCRVMGVRLTPSMSGQALLRATLGSGGEVLDVVAVRVEGLPRPVVQCLLDRLARAHFDPRGGYGSVLDVPVDFTREADRPATHPTLGTSVPTQTL